MMDNINATLVDLLIDDKECAQTLLDTAHNAVEQCATDRSGAFVGPIAGANTTQQGAEDEFHECKDEQVSDTVFLEREQSMPTPSTQTGHDYSQGTSNHNWTRVWNNEDDATALGGTSHE